MSRATLFWAALAFVLALFLAVTVAVAYTGASAKAGAGAAAPAVNRLEVSEHEFALEPAALTIAAGAPTTIRVRNVGQAEHDLTVEGVAATEPIQPGEEAVLELPALEAGSYKLLCTLPGHAGAGMEGTLTVGEGPVAAPAAPGAGVMEPGAGMDLSAQDMARLHEQGVLDFPAETIGKGGVPLEPRVEPDGTKVFELTASEIDWETEPGTIKQAMAYNGMVPGPRLEANLGDKVRIILHNELSEPTALHSHGLLVPNAMDGVPGLNQPSIMPGESFSYEFTLRNSGSHMYHSHFDAAKQVTSGLLGAFIVRDPATEQPVDLDTVMILNDGPLGFTLNGKGFPATEPIVAQLGQTVRVRYMNEGLQIHPMHLHGIPQRVVAKDGWPLAQPYTADTVLVAPGERLDVLIEATEPGAWAFHCHILNHVEAEDGMFGMVTAMVATRPVRPV